jgi:hypothetical protein
MGFHAVVSMSMTLLTVARSMAACSSLRVALLDTVAMIWSAVLRPDSIRPRHLGRLVVNASSD